MSPLLRILFVDFYYYFNNLQSKAMTVVCLELLQQLLRVAGAYDRVEVLAVELEPILVKKKAEPAAA